MANPKRSSTLQKTVDPSAGPRPHDAMVIATGADPVRDLGPVRGPAFRTQLRELAAGTRDAVLLGAAIPVRYSRSRAAPGDLSKSADLSVAYSYTRKAHASTRTATEWTQGWMEPASGTEWSSMLPEKLSMERATDTVRAMKAIMGHPVKPKDLRGITRKTTAHVMAKPAVLPAATSFVEDVTGELAGATRHTGSAIRAAFLRAKLQMKNEGAEEATGFRAHVMGQLTQLGSGGAAELARTIHDELRTGPSATATAYASKVRGEHDLLHDQINTRFTKKHTRYMTLKASGADAVRRELGDWWADADRSDADAARGAYATHKYRKHGISEV